MDYINPHKSLLTLISMILHISPIFHSLPYLGTVTVWLSQISPSLISPLFFKQCVISSSLVQFTSWSICSQKDAQRHRIIHICPKNALRGCQVAGWLHKLHVTLVPKQPAAVASTDHILCPQLLVTGSFFSSIVQIKRLSSVLMLSFYMSAPLKCVFLFCQAIRQGPGALLPCLLQLGYSGTTEQSNPQFALLCCPGVWHSWVSTHN